MATVTVGTGGDYSTIAAAEADLDNSGVHSAAQPAIFELFNQAFNEAVTVDGGGTLGISEFIMRPAAGAGHTGIAGTGARITGAFNHLFTTGAIFMRIRGLEFDGQGGDVRELVEVGAADDMEVSQCIVHGIASTAANLASGITGSGASTRMQVQDNIVYDIRSNSTGGASGVSITAGANSTSNFDNNTADDIECTNGTSGNGYGFFYPDDADLTLRNNLATNMAATAGTPQNYAVTSPVNAVTATNGGDDATSPQAGLRNLSIAYVNAAGRDYRLAAGDLGAMNVGTDLGAVQAAIDILGRNRDTQGDVWDLGAHEFVPSAVLPWDNTKRRFFFRGARR